jgi:glycosyltransferase involved in cell wall biosynthesis
MADQIVWHGNAEQTSSQPRVRNNTEFGETIVRVCFVAYGAYPLLEKSAKGGIGGAEVRAMTFANGLRALSQHSIQIVVGSSSNCLAERINGIEVQFRNLQQRPGFLTKLGQSLGKRITGRPTPDLYFRQLDTDALLMFGLRNDTASAVRAARESGKQVVLFLTSDRNLDDAARRGRHDRGVYGERGYLCRFSLMNADRIVVQTPRQQSRLWDDFKLRSQLIPNPIVTTASCPPLPRDDPPMALWVGRADTFSKRANLCVDLARRCPQISFVMIMNQHDPLVFDEISSAAPRNVSIVERVPFDEIETYYQRATVLVNTSAAEGFPNSFLQAGKFGTPVVSLSVDPARMLTDARCGNFANDNLHDMANAIKRLCHDGDAYHVLSRNIRDYVIDRHDAAARCGELSRLLDELQATRAAA